MSYGDGGVTYHDVVRAPCFLADERGDVIVESVQVILNDHVAVYVVAACSALEDQPTHLSIAIFLP